MALQVWLPLNGNLNNQGLKDVNVTNNGAVVNSGGKIGNCYEFNIASSSSGTKYIRLENPITDLIESGQSFSFACFIKISGNFYSNGCGLISCSVYKSSGVALCLKAAKTLCVQICDDGTELEWNPTMTALTNDAWHHICVTYNKSLNQLAAYINGILVDTKTTTQTWRAGNTKVAIGVGTQGGWGYTLPGYMNDVRIYNHCLSSKEVNEISKGLVLHYKLAESDKLNANLVTESEARVTSNGTASTNEYASVCNTLPIFDTYGLVPYTLSFDIKAAVAHSFSLYGTSGSNPKYTFTQKSINVTTEWQRISYTFTPTLSAENGTWARISVYGVYGSGAIVSLRNVKLELGEIETPFGVDTGIIADVSGYKHNGTVTGNLKLSSNSPRYKSSLYFDGSSYIKTLPGELSWSNFEQLTIAAWMKPTVTPSNYTGSIGIGHDSSNGHKLFAISNYAGKFYLNMTNGSYVNINSGYTCPLNEWHHYAVTLNGVTLNMYVDGVVVKTTTIDFGTAAIHSNPQFQVGVDLPGTDEKYTGYYSDVRIYATALSAEDINDLYHTSAFVDDGQNIETFEFDEVTSDSPNITKSGIFMAQTFTEDTSAEIYTAEVKANQLIEI